MELRFPLKGVTRNSTLRATPDMRGTWPSPWAVNCRAEDNIDRRLRGGSRPGVTKFVADDMGAVIADITSISVARTTGASEILVVLVDSTVKTVENGTTTTPVAYLTNAAGDTVQTAAGDDIVLSSATAPAAGFLVTGQQQVFAVTTSGVVKIDPKDGLLRNVVASGGTIPTNCTFGAVYRDRLCVSGADNAIYMSAQGDYADWNYGAHFENSGRAIVLQLSLSSDVGAAPTALMAHKDAYLLAASKRTLWVIHGDPGADGVLRRVSENVGVISSRAWCRIDDAFCFLAEDGIYSVNGDGSSLTPLSKTDVPDELRDVNTATTTVTMGYEHDKRAVHVFLRTSSGSDTHWVYEMAAQSWWPVRLPDAHSPLATCQHQGEMLLAGSDGYIRKIGGSDDDGTSIESHVAIGPLRLGTPNHFGRMKNLHASLAAGGGTVQWRIVTGSTAEEAADNAKLAIEAFQAGASYANYVKASGAWTAGRANMAYPRVRAVWACLWLQSTATWGYEGVVATAVRSGRWKGE
tara:strand:- start:591 stop:2153 length:1563 start_codon:yes stop_codon:yes gene_type:complete